MDYLFNAFMSRRASTGAINRQSCDDIPDLGAKRRLKRASFGSKQSLPSPSSSELVNVVDEQLMQIREKLAAFRQQDTQFRERMDSLNDSVSELASRSSISSSPSECSDLDSLDEVSEEEEEFEQKTVGQKAFSEEPPRLLRIPTVKVAGRSQFNRPPVGCFHMRQSSDPSSLHSHIELPKEEEMETRRHSTYSADQAINLYPQYNNPEEISTLF